MVAMRKKLVCDAERIGNTLTRRKVSPMYDIRFKQLAKIVMSIQNCCSLMAIHGSRCSVAVTGLLSHLPGQAF